MMQQTCAGALLTLALTLPASASWLSGSELRRHCDAYLENPESRDGALCVAFMQGFLSGTHSAEDEAAAPVGSPSASGDEVWPERAARTRVGSRLRQMAANGTAGYCVGDSVPAITVIRVVTDYLDDDPRNIASTGRRVRDALAQGFPCADG